MKNIIKLAGVAAVALALTQAVQATPIVGNIGFTGGVTFDTTSAANATEVTAWITPSVDLPPTGTFAGIAAGSPATFANVAWAFTTSTPIPAFWSVGGFSFELLSSTLTTHGGTPGVNGYVVVNGTGTVSSTNSTLDSTSISWSFTSQDPTIGSNPNTWTFSASANSVTVPDGGATVMLLGIALSGVALLKRKLKA